jgi:hypothetical protein
VIVALLTPLGRPEGDAITVAACNGASPVIGIHPDHQPHYTADIGYSKVADNDTACRSQTKRFVMKKSLVQAIVIAVVATAPVVSFAQDGASVTRAQVKREIAQLEQSGYFPAGSDIDYPARSQAAEARVGAEHDSVVTTYGGKLAGASEAGSRASAPAHASSLYLDNGNSLYLGD